MLKLIKMCTLNMCCLLHVTIPINTVKSSSSFLKQRSLILTHAQLCEAQLFKQGSTGWMCFPCSG